jgi:hypothetical protein
MPLSFNNRWEGGEQEQVRRPAYAVFIEKLSGEKLKMPLHPVCICHASFFAGFNKQADCYVIVHTW